MTKKSIHVRPARSEDARSISELCLQLGYPNTVDSVTCHLKQIKAFPYQVLFIAERDGKVAGWVHVHAFPLPEMDFHAEIGGLVVDSTQRRSGIGKALMDRAEEWALQNGCRELWLRTNILRKEAHQFYTDVGYQKVKTQFTFRKDLR